MHHPTDRIVHTSLGAIIVVFLMLNWCVCVCVCVCYVLVCFCLFSFCIVVCLGLFGVFWGRGGGVVVCCFVGFYFLLICL